MSLSLRVLAAKTSWPHSSSTLLAHGEWVPVSIAMRSGRSEQKRRLKASGLVRSLPSSITSPLCWSMRHRGRSTCRPSPIRLSLVVAVCYHPSWADPPFVWASSNREPAIAFADPKGTAYGGSAFSSHLPRKPVPRRWVKKGPVGREDGVSVPDRGMASIVHGRGPLVL